MSTKDAAVEKDIYRLRELRPRDLQIVRELVIDRLPPLIREACEGWIPHFTQLFESKARIEESRSPEPAIVQALETSIANLEEDLHGWVEGPAVTFLDMMKRGDFRFLENGEDSAHFWFFIAMQYMRTPARKDAVIESLKGVPDFEAEASWGLLRTVLSTAFGFNMNHRTAVVTLLEAPSDGPSFITGDQPVVNTKAADAPAGVEPAELELYYPISPSRAVLISFREAEDPVTRRRAADRAEVDRLNGMIRRAALRQVYASTKEALS